jgi:hypothetical protein
VSRAAAPGATPLAVASAPGRLPLCGAEPGPRVSVALDRRALCRVEAADEGIALESKDSLRKEQAAAAAELAAREPGSLAAQALVLAGATRGLRVITEWKLPAGSGVDGDCALAVAAVAALTRALGRAASPDELVRLALEAGRRAGRPDGGGCHAALWGGVVLTRGRGETLEAVRLAVDPGRVEEALLLVDTGEPGGRTAPYAPVGDGEGRVERVAEALAAGRSEELLGLLGEEGRMGLEPGAERTVGIVRSAGGAAWRLPNGRLVAVWAPPGPRGPGVGEAVREALKRAGLRPLPVRVDLRGLELD